MSTVAGADAATPGSIHAMPPQASATMKERARSLMAQGFRPRVFPNDILGLSIPLDIDDDALSRLIEALAGV